MGRVSLCNGGGYIGFCGCRIIEFHDGLGGGEMTKCLFGFNVINSVLLV